jgi:hypothetical protein
MLMTRFPTNASVYISPNDIHSSKHFPALFIHPHWGEPTPKSCPIQKQNSGMINTPLNGSGADEKATIHPRTDRVCPEIG